MMDEEYIIRRIKLLRSGAKFIAYEHSSQFTDLEANLGEGYHYVNLYDEKIDSNVIKTPNGMILIHNTYLPSFAYNLFLCWLFAFDSDASNGNLAQLGPLLKHNFKKYFAEQLLRAHNNIFSRSIFLETLLFEQTLMIPVFEARKVNAEFDKKASFASSLMSGIVAFHELGHFYFKQESSAWHEVVKELEVIEEFFSNVSNNYPQLFIEEIQCDIMAIVFCLSQFADEFGREFCLRATVFSFAAFAVLSSLTKSAEATAKDHRKILEHVDFLSIEKQHRDYVYSTGVDIDFRERAKLVGELCNLIAQKEGLTLFESKDGFPLPKTILEDLIAYIDTLLDSNDHNAREMSMLVSEALHEHPQGIEFLYRRSKTFTSNRSNLIP